MHTILADDHDDGDGVFTGADLVKALRADPAIRKAFVDELGTGYQAKKLRKAARKATKKALAKAEPKVAALRDEIAATNKAIDDIRGAAHDAFKAHGQTPPEWTRPRPPAARQARPDEVATARETLLRKAAEMRRQADRVNDPAHARGLRELAHDYETMARQMPGVMN